jgi:hypothetical protein
MLGNKFYEDNNFNDELRLLLEELSVEKSTGNKKKADEVNSEIINSIIKNKRKYETEEDILKLMNLLVRESMEFDMLWSYMQYARQ